MDPPAAAGAVADVRVEDASDDDDDDDDGDDDGAEDMRDFLEADDTGADAAAERTATEAVIDDTRTRAHVATEARAHAWGIDMQTEEKLDFINETGKHLRSICAAHARRATSRGGRLFQTLRDTPGVHTDLVSIALIYLGRNVPENPDDPHSLMQNQMMEEGEALVQGSLRVSYHGGDGGDGDGDVSATFEDPPRAFEELARGMESTRFLPTKCSVVPEADAGQNAEEVKRELETELMSAIRNVRKAIGLDDGGGASAAASAAAASAAGAAMGGGGDNAIEDDDDDGDNLFEATVIRARAVYRDGEEEEGEGRAAGAKRERDPVTSTMRTHDAVSAKYGALLDARAKLEALDARLNQPTDPAALGRLLDEVNTQRTEVLARIARLERETREDFLRCRDLLEAHARSGAPDADAADLRVHVFTDILERLNAPTVHQSGGGAAMMVDLEWVRAYDRDLAADGGRRMAQVRDDTDKGMIVAFRARMAQLQRDA